MAPVPQRRSCSGSPSTIAAARRARSASSPASWCPRQTRPGQAGRPRCGLKVHRSYQVQFSSPYLPALPSAQTGSNKRTSLRRLWVPVMDDLLPGMLHLARDGSETLMRQLTDQLRLLITGGRLAPGQRLPSSRQLAQALDLSRNTVSFAIEQLAAEGYVSLSAGRRPSVSEGLSLDRGKAASKGSRLPAERLPLSAWARGLQRASWPPVYEAGPRPFQPGLADEREFPHDLWSRCLRRAARNALSRRDRAINHPPLQEALLAHLAVHRGIKAKPRQILIVPTAQAGLAMIANVLLERGDHAWIESPGYGGAHVALQAAGAVVAAIPLDEHGITIPARKRTPRLIFVTPSHQYPTARMMPIGRRLDLIRYADAVGASVIE